MTEDTLNIDDAFFENLFEEAGWNEIVTAPPNERRVEEITQRALSETIVKESTSFMFLGFSAALSSMVAALFGASVNNDEDYKP